MMFSTKAEYGIRVMVELARGTGGEPVPLAEIAEHEGLPLAYLEHLVARLRKAELVTSRRGSRGGYMLARPAAEITMAEVVEALEGSIAPIECISEDADGSIVCSRESTPGACVPHEAPVDEGPLLDREHAARDDARRPAAGRAAREHTPNARADRPDAAGARPATPHELEPRRRPWLTWRSETCTSAPRTARSCEGSTSTSTGARYTR